MKTPLLVRWMALLSCPVLWVFDAPAAEQPRINPEYFAALRSGQVDPLSRALD